MTIDRIWTAVRPTGNRMWMCSTAMTTSRTAELLLRKWTQTHVLGRFITAEEWDEYQAMKAERTEGP